MKKTLYQNIIHILPHWHYKIERSIKQKQKNKNISYETYFCLLILKKGGLVKMSEIARDLRLSKQQATQMIDKLYQHGMIDRQDDPQDRRSILIGINDKGKQFLIDNPLDTSPLQEQIQTHLTADEQAEFNQAIETLLRLFRKWD
ncbi:MAG: MarR family transcriptional regulator [Longibaculum muris]|uniref:DNA-binding MarR family transcriptional regulator n=1 Tax=Longibaculum muris TaxID=1796628 RepID=A0A4R3Z2P3_9FIRM|nr:MarR family transcriptional regulator [Longibaculum muris]MBS5368025.1 MarR family transcriptional regulator [Coprobacillus cateniformis]MCR1887710.1 MarR family transcriptional regulator [Longibaculum muris]MED9810811.1 MarR family transcriptional regulator [Longibaculum muris]TCV99444.1 DNA-binding MarR family transcriptional regulator [Longibaculum muris]